MYFKPLLKTCNFKLKLSGSVSEHMKGFLFGHFYSEWGDVGYELTQTLKWLLIFLQTLNAYSTAEKVLPKSVKDPRKISNRLEDYYKQKIFKKILNIQFLNENVSLKYLNSLWFVWSAVKNSFNIKNQNKNQAGSGTGSEFTPPNSTNVLRDDDEEQVEAPPMRQSKTIPQSEH